MRFERGLRLLRQSLSLLRADPELAVLPAAGFALFVIVGAGLFALVFRRWPDVHDLRAMGLVRVYPILIAASIPTTFANAALVAGTMERLRGGDPTIGRSLRAALDHWRPLVAWAIVSGLVGFVLQVVAERIKIAGPIARWAVGLAWQLASTFVVPVMLFEDLGAQPALQRSASLFKQRWGENVTGVGAIGIAMMVLMIPVFVVAGILGAIGGLAVFAISLCVLLTALMTFSATLTEIFNASLYDYAVTGEVRGPFGKSDLDGAFREKRRWLS